MTKKAPKLKLPWDQIGKVVYRNYRKAAPFLLPLVLIGAFFFYFKDPEVVIRTIINDVIKYETITIYAPPDTIIHTVTETITLEGEIIYLPGDTILVPITHVDTLFIFKEQIDEYTNAEIGVRVNAHYLLPPVNTFSVSAGLSHLIICVPETK